MIRILGFDAMLPADVRRGRVKNPQWFRCRCVLSPEAQLLLADPDGVTMFGVWNLIQAYSMRFPERSGSFVGKNQEPMSLDEIAVVIGIPDRTEALEKTIDRVHKLGWVEYLEERPGDTLEDSRKIPGVGMENSSLEERRREKKREEKTREDYKIESNLLAELTKWTGITPGIREACLVRSVIEMIQESPDYEGCPEAAYTALIWQAMSQEIQYRPETAFSMLEKIFTKYKEAADGDRLSGGELDGLDCSSAGSETESSSCGSGVS